MTDLSESFGLVGSCLDSHPVDPGSIPGVHGQPHYQGRNLSFLSFVSMNCMNSRKNKEIWRVRASFE